MPTITTVTPADVPALHKMLCALCAHHGDTCLRGVADIHAQFINGPLTGIIARKGGMPVGFATLATHWRPMQNGDSVDILHLFVQAQRRRQGIGRQLVAAAQTHARKTHAARLTIGTAPDNPQAAAAYRAMGWDEITTQPGPRFTIAF
ncbi:Acetyltransferase (GNAT) family protein [Yoonia tamlensis]|uniref:Acetyltransferase (GNAT) family protein n=1 Tax=Yoonia tamlensis TaxID=390270 RepID=A0A1I6FVX9_9RHOB|nr:GNAT family N-acetyltransferase [Yoonia tamlensis]SFR34089.1 Acetyltransferase (GNAT) family protein [Yoonia tamlensis]